MNTNTTLILLVDDDPAVRMITRQNLAHAGYAVLEAENGKQAQAALDETAPGLILLDAMMPEMDGFEFCAWLRRQDSGKRLPVLMMTGQEHGGAIERAFEVGASDFITKPINPSVLIQRVRFLLHASQTLEELEHSRASLAAAQRIARLGSWTMDLSTNRLSMSEEAIRILGIDPLRFDGQPGELLDLVHPEDREAVKQVCLDSINKRLPFGIDCRLLLPSGTLKWVSGRGETLHGPDGKPVRSSGTVQDITERRQSRTAIHYLSSYDALTGLPNRLQFTQQLDRAISYSRSGRKLIAVLQLGLNRFKRVNESLGHEAGDELLAQVAGRLKTLLRDNDYLALNQREDFGEANLARLSGDEFVVLLVDIRATQDAALVVSRLLGDLAKPYALQNHEVSVDASAGIALFPENGESATELLNNADAAMHFAKRNDTGGYAGGYAFYNTSINEHARLRLSLESALRKALDHNELRPYYQPKVDRDGRITGAELLLRWRHPEMGLLTPDKFITVAEEAGLIVPISDWLMDAAAAQMKQWLKAGHGGISVAINLSPLHFRHPALLDTVRNIMAHHALPAGCLELELTEGMLMADLDETLHTLHALKETGARLAIDDFGTGYSSLSYLTRFPIDVLKIDRSFICGITSDASQMNITRAIISMAHSLKLEVVAEGVEYAEQAELLIKESCDLMQGYLYGRPMPAEEFTQRLANRI